jgi:hypothetical protein
MNMGPLRHIPAVLLFATALGPAGCSFFEAPTRATGGIQLRTLAGDSVATVQATGYSRLSLVATIDRGATDAHRTVVFTTTRGTLSATGNEDTTAATPQRATIIVDGNGEAYVDLLAPNSTGAALVVASVKDLPAVSASMRVTYVPVVADSVIRFDSTTLAADADGFTVKPVTLHIGGDVPAGVRKVTLTATTGSFVGAAPSTPQQFDVTPDGALSASFLYRPPATAGTALIRATLFGVTRDLPVTLRAVPRDSILRVTPPSGSIDADSATVTTIAVWLSPRVPDGSRAVSFTTTGGTLIGSSTPQAILVSNVGQGDSARVDIRSPLTAGIVHLRVTVGSFAQDVPVTFRPALPDTILLDPGQFTMKASDISVVRARMIRRVGTVSQNTFVTFSATDSAGATVGQFRDVKPSDVYGVASVAYSPAEITARKLVTLRASLPDGTHSTAFTIIVEP